MQSIFHIACNVTCLEKARQFYGQLLGCDEGRSTETWVDFNFFGHQLSLHLGEPFPTRKTGIVGGIKVPMPHFGVLLSMEEWKALSQKLTQHNIEFEYGPTIRFPGEPGEQATMFFHDPSGNPIEIKGFNRFEGVFAK